MRFRGLDLNLLAALSVLLEERSVTGAGSRLFMSQSAMSGVLARLREHFVDQLLENSGRRMMLTPFGQSLIAPLKETMRHIEMIAGAAAQFDPSQSHRNFSIVASDYLITTIVPQMLPALTNEAPGVRLTFSQPMDEPGVLMNRGDVDLIITPDGYVSSPHRKELLYEEDHVVLAWAGNKRTAKRLTSEMLKTEPQVVVRFGHKSVPSFAERELERLELAPRIALVVPTFTSVPPLLVGTDLIAVVHRRLAAAVVQQFDLAIRPLPVRFSPMRQMMLFHPLREQDAGLGWLKGRFKDAVRGETGNIEPGKMRFL